MNKPIVKCIEINIEQSNLEGAINSRVLKDFNEFKKNNELTYCSMNQKSPKGNTIEVKFSTIIKYNTPLIDTDILLSDFSFFCKDNSNDFCQITKTDHNEGCFTAEFSVIRIYQLNFVNH